MTITLITGANKGLGYETARQVIELGHTVYLGARSTERGQQAAAELGARFMQLDVAEDESVAAAVKVIEGAEGRIDVLVNNAGIMVAGVSGPEALRVFDTNAVGVIRVTEAALPLRKSRNPVVVNPSSNVSSFWVVTESDRPESRFLLFAGVRGIAALVTSGLVGPDAADELTADSATTFIRGSAVDQPAM